MVHSRVPVGTTPSNFDYFTPIPGRGSEHPAGDLSVFGGSVYNTSPAHYAWSAGNPQYQGADWIKFDSRFTGSQAKSVYETDVHGTRRNEIWRSDMKNTLYLVGFAVLLYYLVRNRR